MLIYLSSVLFFFFFKINFFKNFFQKSIKISNSLDPDQARQSLTADASAKFWKHFKGQCPEYWDFLFDQAPHNIHPNLDPN